MKLMKKETIGQRLKRLREAKGYTKYRLAKKSGIGQTWIYHCEKDHIKNPRGDTLLAISKGLDITIGELTGENHKSIHDVLEDAQHRLEQLEVVEIPIYASVPAENTAHVEQIAQGHLAIMRMDIAMQIEGLYALQVDNDSLSGDDIHENDYIIVYPTSEIIPGKIHVLQSADDVQIGHVWEIEDRIFRVESSNPAFPALKVHNAVCCGRVILSGRWRKH